VLFFWNRVLHYAKASLHHNLSIYSSPHSWAGRQVSLSPVTGWDGGLSNILPKMTLNYRPPNLCLPIARITGLSNQAWPRQNFFKFLESNAKRQFTRNFWILQSSSKREVISAHKLK
jgi:hypothetical protein